MKPNKLSLKTSPSMFPVYGIATIAAVVSMAQGGVQATLLVFGLSLFAAVAVEVMKLRR